MILSIIVPVYNMAGEGKLNFCLDSLVNQTVSDYEIIAVDDGSTDDSPAILREYESRYPGKVKAVISGVNRHQGGAKNEGIRVSSGEWLGFVDSDDWVAPDCYEKLLRKADDTGADLVGCDYCLVSEHTFRVGQIMPNNSLEQTGVLDEEKHKSLILRPDSMVVKIYRASVVRENCLVFPEDIFYEDNCAASVWFLYFRHFEKVEEPLYYYYQHEASTVHAVTEEKCRDRMKAMELFVEESRKRGFLEQYREEIEFRFTELFYMITLFSYMQGVRHPKLAFIRELRERTRELFPHFAENRYYEKLIGREERRLLSMQMNSDLRFYLYHRLQIIVRRLRHR